MSISESKYRERHVAQIRSADGLVGVGHPFVEFDRVVGRFSFPIIGHEKDHQRGHGEVDGFEILQINRFRLEAWEEWVVGSS